MPNPKKKRGRVIFGDEQEALQSEALAGRIINQAGPQIEQVQREHDGNPNAPSFTEAAREEHKRQMIEDDVTRPSPVRLFGERLADRPGPTLDAAGDPVLADSPESDPGDEHHERQSDVDLTEGVDFSEE